MTDNIIKILVIDDDPTLANTLKLFLENVGYEVDIASDGETALEMVSQKFYDILLCDYNLPDIMGLELVRKALAVSPRSIPILVTGTRSMELALDGMRLGVHDYLVKPIDYDELMELRQKEVRLGTGDKLMELFTTHPNMLKRIKHLSTLAV